MNMLAALKEKPDSELDMIERVERVADLKRRARKLRLAAYAISDARGADCGHELLKHISGDYSEACRKFNEVYARLLALDPDCPKGGEL